MGPDAWEDTIAAIATPPGEGALAIVRLSGPESVEVAAKCVRNGRRIRNAEGMSLRVVTLCHSDGTVIDQVVAAVYRTPNSYTGEDMVELSCHGGHSVPRRVLERLLSAGARPAEPGEFTRRAYLNGKMDLSQAEAVAELIRSGTDKASRAAAQRLDGGLRKSVEMMRGKLIEILADVEARLDLVDDEIDPLPKGELAEKLGSVRKEVAQYLGTYRQGRLLMQGATVVLAGAPNSGKSTLFNKLVQRDRMVVSSVPGTTRDAVEEWVDLNGVPVKLVDTAGIRTGGGKIEQESIRRTVERLNDADLVVLLVDGNAPKPPHPEVIKQLGSVKVLPVWSKSDRPRKGLCPEQLSEEPETSISSVKGKGVEHLKLLLLRHIWGDIVNDSSDVLIGEERQNAALEDAQQALDRVVAAEADGAGMEIVTLELRTAVTALGQITGQEIGDEVLDRIFAKFCIGK